MVSFIITCLKTSSRNSTSLKTWESRVYPSPLGKNDNLSIAYNLDCVGKLDCYIADIVGKRIQSINLECGKRIIVTPINEISLGIYTIIITQNDKQVFTQKIAIQ